MGRATGVKDIVKVDAKKFAKRAGLVPCFEETSSLLSCLKDFDFESENKRCRRQIDALGRCMKVHAESGKQDNTINFHLARLSKLGKRGGR
mmetsp:Transcript_26527/g.86974  ORF Transcript_26527/g.86974 Transcript_26527/m.86974 type:complete len:91 (-) Transcript_26527:59-331(-)